MATAFAPDLPFLDPRTMTQQMVPATIVLLAGVAATASILPARRAARVDPVVALDGE